VLFLADGRAVADFAPDGPDEVLGAMKELTSRWSAPPSRGCSGARSAPRWPPSRWSSAWRW